MDCTRLLFAAISASAFLFPIDATLSAPKDPGTPTERACQAAHNICLAACKINNEYNNTGGFGGLPLLSFLDNCQRKCDLAYIRCGQALSVRPGLTSRPPASLVEESDDGDEGDRGDTRPGKGHVDHGNEGSTGNAGVSSGDGPSIIY